LTFSLIFEIYMGLVRESCQMITGTSVQIFSPFHYCSDLPPEVNLALPSNYSNLAGVLHFFFAFISLIFEDMSMFLTSLDSS